ncbi:MAG TPA: hypothetical protein VHN80_12315 [Kineosporiaceae bacterium]|nr:hypothetical protein [Kineosporiaceae bacterium]
MVVAVALWRRSMAASGPRFDCARRLWQSAARGAPAGAPVVIVVRLVSATRRPTVLYAHHDHDGAAPMVIVVRLVSATRRTTEHCAHHDRDGRLKTKARDEQARDEGP